MHCIDPSARSKYYGLPAPSTVSNWAELRIQAARRMVQAPPSASYMSPVRQPRQAPETVQMAIDAVHHAAPLGDVSRPPRPWRFTEAFLFDEQRRFKPRSLDA